MRNGIPFDVAFGVDEVTRAAWCIVFSEMEGRVFDWSSMRFREPE